MSRRHLLGRTAALTGALCAGAVLDACGKGAPSRPAPAGTGTVLTLTPPTGPYPVGTTALHLVDPSRADPFTRGAARRELMVYVWYPAGAAGRDGPWLAAEAAAVFRDQLVPAAGPSTSGAPGGPGGAPPSGGPVPGGGAPPSGGVALRTMPGTRAAVVRLDGVRLPTSHAAVDAPARAAHPAPVVLWSPGHGDPAALGTQFAEDLASHGYVVVTVDHTYDAAVVEFPGRRLVRAPADPRVDLAGSVAVRGADLRFVLACLDGVRAARNPDADLRPLPPGLAALLDLRSVGIAGHSLGGAAAAGAMGADRRLRAGANLDGSIVAAVDGTSPVAVGRAIAGRPFLVMTSDGHGPDGGDTTLTGFWSGLTGRQEWLALRGAGHHSFTDRQTLLPQVASRPGVAAAVRQAIGTVDPARSVAAQRASLLAFFDTHLRGGTGSRPRSPEMRLVAS